MHNHDTRLAAAVLISCFPPPFEANLPPPPAKKAVKMLEYGEEY
jgi:hypothetical protein